MSWATQAGSCSPPIKKGLVHLQPLGTVRPKVQSPPAMFSGDRQMKGQGSVTGSGAPTCPAENLDMCQRWGFQPKHMHWPRLSHQSSLHHRRDPPGNKAKQAFPGSASSARTDMVPAGHGSHQRLPCALRSDATRVHHCHVCFHDRPADSHSWEHIFSCKFFFAAKKVNWI